MGDEESPAKGRKLSGLDLEYIQDCEFDAAVRPEIGMIRGVGTTLEDLFRVAGKTTDNRITLAADSVMMLGDVVQRAIDDLEKKLEAASDWFRTTGLDDVVRAQRDQRKTPAGVGHAGKPKGA